MAKTKKNSQEVPILTLVSIKQWYVPADTQTYKFLCKIGFPATRIHEDLIPIIKDVAKKHGVTKIIGRPFAKVLDEYQTKVGKFWLQKPDRDADLKSKEFVFTTTKQGALDHAKNKSLPKLEVSLRKFFQRWGFSVDTQYSESRGRMKFAVTFEFRTLRKPVIPIKSVLTDSEPTILQLGFSRFVFREDSKYVHWNLERKQGSEWVPITAGKCLPTEVTDPTKTIGLLLRAYNED